MRTITFEAEVKPDHTFSIKLPDDIPVGRRQFVLVIDNQEDDSKVSQTEQLMKLSEKVNAFQSIEDPVAYQRDIRSEWDNRLD